MKRLHWWAMNSGWWLMGKALVGKPRRYRLGRRLYCWGSYNPWEPYGPG